MSFWEIPNNPVTEDQEFCEFYQFVEDYFLYLISPSVNGSANWNDNTQFPLLETRGTDSCDETFPQHAFNIRHAKSADENSDYLLPERTEQALGEAIYDQNGNVVFYEIRFSKNLCNLEEIKKLENFPGGTVELKMAWKVLTLEEIGRYVTIDATIAAEHYTLGLIGWHIVVSANNHPEMVWATVVHGDNAVVCNEIGQERRAFPFTSQACAGSKENCVSLNKTQKGGLTTNTPYDICQEFPYGTLEGRAIESNNGLNISLIQKLNKQLKKDVLTASGVPASMSLWKNYQFTGALWLSEPRENDSRNRAAQRGSLELANEVMETRFQGHAGVAGEALNCFGCHHYKNKQKNTSVGSTLSHIFDDIVRGKGRK